ncbi:MAG: FHA domain-containing protein [Planctomycetes bacterium]|nr:FHA domain-containing protein [Planctomycetota bacterium]
MGQPSVRECGPIGATVATSRKNIRGTGGRPCPWHRWRDLLASRGNRMPRFQLLIREPAKEPRTVALGDPVVVGRSRNADLAVEDEEVGRKQFRIGVTSGFVVLEGLGTTNPTRVDDGVIGAGDRTTLAIGAIIRVGKTTFEVQSADSTQGEAGNPGEIVERTMVAPGPAGGPPRPAPPAPPKTDEVPLKTLELKGPGAPGAPAAPAPASPGTQMYRPGSGPPPAQPDVAGADEVIPEQTMQLRPGGFRPGAPAPAPARRRRRRRGATPAASPPPPAPSRRRRSRRRHPRLLRRPLRRRRRGPNRARRRHRRPRRLRRRGRSPRPWRCGPRTWHRRRRPRSSAARASRSCTARCRACSSRARVSSAGCG